MKIKDSDYNNNSLDEDDLTIINLDDLDEEAPDFDKAASDALTSEDSSDKLTQEKLTSEDSSNKLTADDLDPETVPAEAAPAKETMSQGDADTAPGKRWWRFIVNPHVLFLLGVVVIILFIFYRFANWGKVIDLKEFFEHNEVEIQEDTLDTILPLTDEDGKKIATKNPPSILFFGNNPFDDERDSDTGIVNLVKKQTGATVYNLAVPNSYLASYGPSYYGEDRPMDPFCLYWMLVYLTYKDSVYDYHQLPELLGEQYPQGFDETLSLLDTIDMNSIDVIAIMYDGTDYLMGRPAYNDSNYTDVTTFNGNLEGSIELIQQFYPHIRIIVMSPTYAYALDENGEYVSSDLKAYCENFVLASFVTREGFSATSHGVTFVDNLYGSVTEDNASQYLSDYIHLNEKGRQLIADRFIYALNYFNN